MAREANSDFVLLRKRTDAGLLGGMMGVPVSAWEASLPVSPFGNAPVPGPWREAGTVRHTFTHFHLELRVFAKICGAPFAVEGEWARFEDLDCFALPTVMLKAIALGASAERSVAIQPRKPMRS
jgi:A/G-specific adenine glycosylase